MDYKGDCCHMPKYRFREEPAMVVGNLYKLRNDVISEHQDHVFVYPAGLVVELEEIGHETKWDIFDMERAARYDEDWGEGYEERIEPVYQFMIPDKKGHPSMFSVFRPNQLEPAKMADLDKQPRVEIYRS
jgi:hypothetical protein